MILLFPTIRPWKSETSFMLWLKSSLKSGRRIVKKKEIILARYTPSEETVEDSRGAKNILKKFGWERTIKRYEN